MAKTSTKTVATRVRKTRKDKAAARPTAKTQSKQSTVLTMLRRQHGASIPEIVDATDWQPHSARAFLTAAVKKRLGISVISEKGEDGVRRYYVAPLASSAV
jgi:hypothetical protein